MLRDRNDQGRGGQLCSVSWNHREVTGRAGDGGSCGGRAGIPEETDAIALFVGHVDSGSVGDHISHDRVVSASGCQRGALSVRLRGATFRSARIGYEVDIVASGIAFYQHYARETSRT